MNLYIVTKYSEPGYMCVKYVVAAENESRAKNLCAERFEEKSSMDCLLIGIATNDQEKIYLRR